MKGHFVSKNFIMGFGEKLTSLSSAPYRGGLSEAEGFFFMHVDKNYSGNHRLDCEEFSVKHGLKEFVGFMTAVDIPKVLSYSKKGGVEVYATAGLSNLNEFGTINVCVVISGLTLNGMVNALMTATEAKAKIVYEKCGVTGTTSDAMGIFSRRGDIEWAGSATETGRDIERAVSEAVKESIKKWESLDES